MEKKKLKVKINYSSWPVEKIPSQLNKELPTNEDYKKGIDRNRLARAIDKHQVCNYRHMGFVRGECIDRLIEAIFSKQKDSYTLIDKHHQYLSQQAHLPVVAHRPIKKQRV